MIGGKGFLAMVTYGIDFETLNVPVGEWARKSR